MLARWESDWENPKDSSKIGYETLRQITVSPSGEILVVGVASSRVIRFDRDLNYLGDLSKNIHGPWGITVDTRGVMYVANFSREMGIDQDVEIDVGPRGVNVIRGGDVGPYGVTVIEDGDEDTAKLMTLPTGGAEVTLANGLPLYGNPETRTGAEIRLRCHDPLMRLTATSIDRAGNLWACNNWKPSAVIDALRGNPGGDGMVIFVGVAEPSPRS